MFKFDLSWYCSPTLFLQRFTFKFFDMSHTPQDDPTILKILFFCDQTLIQINVFKTEFIQVKDFQYSFNPRVKFSSNPLTIFLFLLSSRYYVSTLDRDFFFLTTSEAYFLNFLVSLRRMSCETFCSILNIHYSIEKNHAYSNIAP